MATVAIELNDTGIGAVRSRRPELQAIPPSPGYALLEGGRILMGVDAVKKARLSPRFIYTRFWEELDRSALPRPFPAKLSRADLAHAHLSDVWKHLRQGTDDVILAAPGFSSDEGLGLILGIARACDMPVAAIVDSSLAAATSFDGAPHLIHLDIFLHRVVASGLHRGRYLSREEIRVEEGFGLIALLDAWVSFIAQSFVRQTRFDPLHHAQTEQALYDLLPHWLQTSRSEEVATFSLEASGKERVVEIHRDDLLECAEPYFERIARLVSGSGHGQEPVTLLVSHRLAMLPGLVARVGRDVGFEVVALEPTAVPGGALGLEETLRASADAGGALSFVTSLALEGRSEPEVQPPPSDVPAGAGDRSPTHVLHAGVAYPIEPAPFLIGVAIPEGQRGLNLTSSTAGISRYHCAIYRSNGRVVVEDHSRYGCFLNGNRVTDKAPLSAGDKLRLGAPGVEIQLIEVQG